MSPPRPSPLREAHDGSSSQRSDSLRSSLSASSLYQPMMPPIAEHETHHSNRYSQVYNRNIIWPQPGTPLRVPRKSPRRALARSQAMSAAAAARAAQGSIGEKDGNCIPPPPYGNTSPPRYGEDTKGGPAAGPAGEERSGWRERQWFGRRRTRWCLCGLLIVVLLGLIVGLSVGLTLGRKNGGGSSKSDGSTPEPSKPVFPEGSYSFETTLQRQATSCTSRESTWRCYPYKSGSNATFFWILSTSENNDLVVTSSENPFAPRFANLTTKMEDKGSANERVTFEFDMERTVVPSDALTSENRAAKCTFPDTKFQATLWTRRGVTGNPDAQASDKFNAWPGDVEITQTKKAVLGQPECVDDNGVQIADVQAGSGDCVCDYANFEL
ncbi:uncharacterized protein J7T54_000644 [Emericellopsis cladophorae]|uniref:Tat pathway signal sequence n=1 Tax=Emericellopsis cladophorae TaxID=2686198 RepID=A0A9Q0BF59_9HYPO|nr:uncharacterized protein J7T54_000644 [Emericellopsis cladophorae]KAI6783142.1 hypothetical protein J7T54_000644 [Emericellopsis cladophorae]